MNELNDVLLGLYKKSLDAYKTAVEKEDKDTAIDEAAKMDSIKEMMDRTERKKFSDERANIRKKLSEINDALMELRDYEGLSDLMQIELIDIQTKIYDMMLDAL
jgi:hypothetical protein